VGGLSDGIAFATSTTEKNRKKSNNMPFIQQKDITPTYLIFVRDRQSQRAVQYQQSLLSTMKMMKNLKMETTQNLNSVVAIRKH